MELYNDQIHAPAFQKECTHFWSDDVSREKKSGVWDYFVNCSKEFDKPLVDQTNIPKSGVIFVGMCHILEDVFDKLPHDGNYLIVHRTNDRPFTWAMHQRKPPSVKHIYTVDCQINRDDTTAIPFGLASINGEDNLVIQIAQEEVTPAETKLFCCYNTNPATPHRNLSVEYLAGKKFANVFKCEYPHKQMPGDEFYRQVKSHKFTMALAGCGADASRQWASIILGSIPIVTDCVEMRHFEDLPLIFCPNNMNELTEDWLSLQLNATQGKSTERMRMSYWANHIKDMRNKHGI